MSEADQNEITIGMMVRALRMGFGWTGGAFLRISGGNPLKLEFYPAGLIPNVRHADAHFVWWGKGSHIPREAWFLQLKAKRHFICYMNDDGEIL